jgi:hypothetical protein
MEVKIIQENDFGNGESSVKFDFVYTPADFAKATTEPPQPHDRKTGKSL